jgi:hypothetical protein
MKTSETLNELATALAGFQGEAEVVSKDSTNPFFKSRYASLPNVVKSAAPLLAKHGLSVSQFLGHDELGDTLTTILLHKSGQYIADTMHLRPIKDDPQAQGSATTYGRRYAYMAATGLVADEDDDGNHASAPTESHADSHGGPKITQKQIEKLILPAKFRVQMDEQSFRVMLAAAPFFVQDLRELPLKKVNLLKAAIDAWRPPADIPADTEGLEQPDLAGATDVPFN